MTPEKYQTNFIKLILDSQNIIFKVCNAYATDQYNVDDLYQEILLNLWKSFPKFRNECSPLTWIYRVALNTSISVMRKQNLKHKFLPIDAEIENRIADEQQKEDIQELYSCIRLLGILDKALVLLWLDGLPYQEIADITGISKTNVATRLNRAKNKLKELMDP